MAQKRTSKFIFSLLLIFTANYANAQKTEWHGILVGADLSRFAIPFIDSTRYGWELSGNYEIIKDLFGNVEIGSQSTKFSVPNYSYTGNGIYTRIGADYNIIKHIDDKSTDKILVGLRYGFSTFYHNADKIIVNSDIWKNYENGSIENNWLAANWLELAFGMRAHLFNNFYLGWTARLKMKLFFPNDQTMQPYHIPGYGRAWKSGSVGFNYSLYYKIPFLKKKVAPKEKHQAEG